MIRDNARVRVDYHGTDVFGTVVSSRVAYGGQIRYSIKLNRPTKLPWRNDTTSVILANADKVTNLEVV
jgi:hypothetical protein